MIVKLAHIYKFPKGGLVLDLPSHPLDCFLLMVHLDCGVELSDHGFIPIVLECHDLLQPSLFNFGQQTPKRLVLAHEVPIHPLLVSAYDSLLDQAPEEVILVLGMKERT